MIRPAISEDAARITAIYNHYIENTTVTFEELPVSVEDMRDRITHGAQYCPWLVAEANEMPVAYAYASPWSERAGYRTSAETTIYVAEHEHRQGHGAKLYRALIDKLRTQQLHSAIGVIALPNPGSIVLHENFGFRKIGEFQEVGKKFGQWINVGYWQLLL